MNLSFKNRIALFNVIAMSATAVLVFTAIYGVVYSTAIRHLDEDILTEKEEVFNNLDWKSDSIIINKMPEWDEAEHNKVEVNPTFLQIVDLKGRVVFHSTNLQRNSFHFNPKNDDETFFNGSISRQEIRLGQFAIRNESGKKIGQLTIAISQKESASILYNLILVLIISFPVTIIVQYFASRIAALKAISPVHQLIHTASGISDSNIHTRLSLPASHDEIYQLAQTINELLNRIESSMNLQKQFTSDASHEIRTPVAAIKGTLEVLLRKKREPEVYEQKIRDVIRMTDRLERLLDQLLQLARFESGAYNTKKEKVFLTSIIHSLIVKYSFGLSEQELRCIIDIAEETELLADSFLLEIILDNLFSNAIKYSNKGGTILLTWDEQNCLLSVKDDGPGIPEEQIPFIFDRFYRADASRSSEIQGSGLGLSIAGKLANLQHITISVYSKTGEGSVFTLQFPSC